MTRELTLYELYVLAQSRDRVAKERAMRQRQLKRLWARLKLRRLRILGQRDKLKANRSKGA